MSENVENMEDESIELSQGCLLKFNFWNFWIEFQFNFFGFSYSIFLSPRHPYSKDKPEQ